MSDGIIDIRAYLDDKDASPAAKGTFSLWGADGDRSRFALPLWRIVYLCGGRRGAIVSRGRLDPDGWRAFVVLDLVSDPARLEFDQGVPDPDPARGLPDLVDLGGLGLIVHLGLHKERLWSVWVDGGSPREALNAKAREDILFLAGECAGLLFLRELADDIG